MINTVINQLMISIFGQLHISDIVLTFRMETRYSRTLVLLPRLSPIGKIVYNFKPLF
jgi:hypothetical protein